MQFCRRVDISDEDEPERPVWPPRRLHLKFDDGDHEQEKDTEPEPPKRKNKARCRVNPFIDAEAWVDGDASNDEESDEESDDENDDLDRFIVADDIEFKITYHLSYIISYFIVLGYYISNHQTLYISHAFMCLH